MGPFRRYFVTMVLALLAVGTVSGVLQGQGIAAPFGALVAFLWLGWFVPLLGLPVFIALLWALPRAFQRFPTTARPIVGAATGLAVWAIVALVLVGIAAAASEVGPGSTPPTPLGLLGFSVVIGVFGALLGLIEARAW